MGYLTLSILGFSALALLFGMLVGFLRGANRAWLRLGLIVLTIVLAFLLRPVVYNTVIDLEFVVDEQQTTMSLGDVITNAITDALGDDVPASINDLVFALTEIMIGLVAFFMLFVVIRLVSWLILFPILKIFVKKGERRRRGIGALVGLLQGALIAFVICAPITGLFVQTDKISKIEFQGSNLVEIPEEIGLGEYLVSAPGKVYTKSGSWFFNLLTSAKTESGTKVTIEDTCDILSTSAVIADKLENLTSDLQGITKEDATPEERIDSLKAVGNALVEVGNSIDSLSTDAKIIAKEIISEFAASFGGEGSEIPEELAEILENIDFERIDLGAAGGALNAIATIIEKDGSAPISADEATAIVDGIAQNVFLIDIFIPESEDVPVLLELSEQDASTVESAISSSSLSNEHRDLLRNLLGLS